MAIRVSKGKDGKISKTIGDKYGIILKTEELYGKRAKQCAELGLISLSGTQLATITGFVGIAAVKPTQQYLHSSDNTHGKTLIPIGTNLNHGPLKQQSKSSVEVNETILQYEIIKRLLKAKTGSDLVYAYFLTPTYQNCDVGELAEDAALNSSRVTDLLRSLNDGATRNNGVQLVGGQYVGALITREITINEEKFKAQSKKGVWNDHVHIVLLSDKPLDVKKTEKVLFKKWKSLNPEPNRVNRGAFNFKAAYDLKKPGNADKDAIASAMKEAIKYSIKPSDLNMLCERDDDYSLAMFAELFNALHGSQLKRRHGLWWNAKNFLSLMDEFKNAIRLTTVEEFPDVVTQLSKLVYNHAYKKYGRYEAVYERELSADEILYHNRSLIEKILVTDDVIDRVHEFLKNKKTKITNEMKQFYAETFKDITFCNTIDDLLTKLQSFSNMAKRHNKALKSYDIELLSKSIQEKYKDGCLKLDLSQYKNMILDKRAATYDLYDANVAIIKGSAATSENKANWATFADKQGLSVGNIKDVVRVDLFAAADWSDEKLDDYFGNAFIGKAEWAEFKKIDTVDHFVKVFKLLNRNVAKMSFVPSFPVVVSVPKVELNRPKIVLKEVFSSPFSDVKEYDAVYVNPYELSVIGVSSTYICDDYEPVDMADFLFDWVAGW